MTPGASLAGWLARPDTQAGSGRDAVLLHPLCQPSLSALASALDALVAPTLAEVEQVLAPILTEASWVESWIERLAEEARSNSFFIPPLSSHSNGSLCGFQLLSHPLVQLSLNVLTIDALAEKKMLHLGPAAITFPGTVTLQRFLRAGDAALAFWKAPAATENFGASDNARCRPDGSRRLRDGDFVRLDGRRESYVVEHANADLVILQAEVLLDRSPFLVEYDADGHSAVAASSTDENASRNQMLLSFLGQFGRPGDHETLAALTDDPRFFVRWHAIRELLIMNMPAAMPRLQEMAQADPHLEVRQAAAGLASALMAASGDEDQQCPV